MRLLLSLILALTEDEAARIFALHMKGKQLAVMTLLLACRKSGAEPSSEQLAELNVSDTHLYEICSVMLAKVLNLLAPKGGVAILEFIAYKNLNIHFRSELRKQRKFMDRKKGKEAEEFFLSAFELFQRFSYNLIEHDVLAELGDAYLAAKKNVSTDDALAIETRKLGVRMIGIIADGKNFGKEQEEVFEKLRELEQKARNSSNSYFCFSVYSGLAWYWNNLGSKPDNYLRYLQRAIPYSEKLEGYIFRELPEEMKLRLADAHFILGGTKEALEIFERTYSSVRQDHIIWKRNYYLFRYIEILIYNGKYSQAEQLLKKYFEPMFSLRPTTTSATAATQFAMLYLFTDNYKKALHYLEIGMKLNVKTNFTLYNEVRNRLVESIYYYLIGDWTHVTNLTTRAMQYLYSHRIGLNKHIFGYNFKIIEASIAYHSNNKPFTPKLEAKYKELTLSKEGLFGLLIKKVRQLSKNRDNY
jgi:hypothetical protein